MIGQASASEVPLSQKAIGDFFSTLDERFVARTLPKTRKRLRAASRSAAFSAIYVLPFGKKVGGEKNPAPDHRAVRFSLDQCDEERIVSPFGTRVSSTIFWISALGGGVIKLTATIATRLTGIPMMPKRRWSIPNQGSMPAKRTA